MSVIGPLQLDRDNIEWREGGMSIFTIAEEVVAMWGTLDVQNNNGIPTHEQTCKQGSLVLLPASVVLDGDSIMDPYRQPVLRGTHTHTHNAILTHHIHKHDNGYIQHSHTAIPSYDKQFYAFNIEVDIKGVYNVVFTQVSNMGCRIIDWEYFQVVCVCVCVSSYSLAMQNCGGFICGGAPDPCHVCPKEHKGVTKKLPHFMYVACTTQRDMQHTHV